jgi:hypothetical protein
LSEATGRPKTGKEAETDTGTTAIKGIRNFSETITTGTTTGATTAEANSKRKDIE